MALGAVQDKPAAARGEGTPGVSAPGEMSPKVLVLLIGLSFCLVFGLIGGSLREGFGASTEGAVETTTSAPGSSTTNPAGSPLPPPPPPPPAAPVEAPPAPQPEVYEAEVVAPAPAPEPPPPQPAPAAPSVPDILAPILPFLFPPPPPPPPAP
ncbi:hypothetical protein [Nocardia sp. NPDC127526]|uniref:hypothetical protein n=1 Tax=Nocardia sp. NPDC127526 TaxID=3345393 RepID=UPI003630036E